MIPPPLDDNLKMQDVSKLWSQGPEDDGYDPDVDCSKVTGYNPCELTWIAAPTGIFRAGALKSFMSSHTVQNDGWGVIDDIKMGWKNKLGWEPKKRNASFTMELKNTSKDIKVVTLMYLKSYGEKWANSTARFTLRDMGSLNQTVSRDLVGYHESKTSIGYTERIVLPASIPKGSTMQLRVELVDGTTFKISGMMFCSW